MEIQFGGGGRGGGVPGTLDISYLEAGGGGGMKSHTDTDILIMSKSGKDIRPSALGRPQANGTPLLILN